MRTIITTTALAVVVICCLPLGTVLAQGDDSQTDVFSRNGRLAVWVDVTDLLTAEDYRRLKDGVDLAIELKFRLVRPRRLFGEKEIATETQLIRLHHSPVTADFTISRLSDSESVEYQNISRVQMDRLLSDSVVISLAYIETLDPDREYRISLNATIITLTDINLSRHRDADSTDGESAVQFLFRQFLSVTGYGRRETSARSDPFGPRELPEGR